METINDLLGYNNLKIVQNDSWFKFSLDSVLLANFATINFRTSSILDLCTGNAPIPIIFSTRTKHKIKCVELQKDIYDLACKSVQLNNLSDRIDILNYNVRNLLDVYSLDSFDLITCNPPYFKFTSNSVMNDNSIKAIARHEIELKLEDVISISSKLLKSGGYFSLVHRPERFIEIVELFKKYNIEPKRIQFIYPKLGSKANILLIEGVKNGKTGLVVETPLYVYNEDNTYTSDIKKYLKCNI